MVNPACSVSRARRAPFRIVAVALWWSASAGSLLSAQPSATCVWQSISPGRTVSFDQSITVAVAGGGVQGWTAVTRPSVISIR